MIIFQVALGVIKLYDDSKDGSTYTRVGENRVPDNFTTTGSSMLIELHSGPVLTSINIYAEITARNISSNESKRLGEDNFCSLMKECNTNEGDCDFNTHCNGSNSWCKNNGCLHTQGFSSGTDCCQDACHGLIDLESGLLVSPSYPNDYLNSVQCSSQISVDLGNHVTLEFTSFSVSIKYAI